MIIGLDISSIPYGTGVSDYTLSLVRHLVKIDSQNQYKLLFYSYRQALPVEIQKLSSKPNVKIYQFRLPPKLIEILWNRLHFFPLEWFIGKCDIFHTWEWVQPPTLRSKLVSSVHDLVPFLYPEHQHPDTVNTFKRKFRWIIKEKTHLICSSQNTQKDLLHLFPQISPSLTTVILLAAEEKYDQFYRLSATAKRQKETVIHQQYGLDHFFLAQGTREPRKNLDRLVQAFIAFKTRHPQSKQQLAITGKYGWGNDINTPQSQSIRILGYIPEKDMVALHSAAICLVYPSLYEGFGLPLVKSMKVGTPIITSNTSSMPEVVGKSALLINPESIDDLSCAIEKIATSFTLRQRLSRAGLKQAKKFSWENTARQTLTYYQSVFSSS